MRNDISNKRRYVRPEVERMEVDHQISMELSTSPDSGGPGTFSSMEVSETMSLKSSSGITTSEETFGGNSVSGNTIDYGE